MGETHGIVRDVATLLTDREDLAIDKNVRDHRMYIISRRANKNGLSVNKSISLCQQGKEVMNDETTFETRVQTAANQGTQANSRFRVGSSCGV
jgi:hypothetical protein